MCDRKYLSWIRPFESSRAFLTLRLYKTPHAGVLTLTLKRPCAGVLTDLKSGREPFALAWHTPRGPIFEYFFFSFVSKFSFSTSPSVSKTFLWPSGVHGLAQGKRSYICSQDAISSNLENLTSLVQKKLEQSFCFTSSPWQRSWQRVTWQAMNILVVLKSHGRQVVNLEVIMHYYEQVW